MLSFAIYNISHYFELPRTGTLSITSALAYCGCFEILSMSRIIRILSLVFKSITSFARIGTPPSAYEYSVLLSNGEINDYIGEIKGGNSLFGENMETM